MYSDKSETSIDPSISKDDVYKDYFEKYPYLARRAITNEIIEWPKLSDIVYASNPDQSSEIRIFMNGQVPFIQYAEKYQDLDVIKYRLLIDRVTHLLSSGATIVLNGLER
nr:hypothetical protein [Burkholderia ambifaria]